MAMYTAVEYGHPAALVWLLYGPPEYESLP